MIEQRNVENYLNSSQDRTIEGYALIFDTRSNDLGGFYEVIERSALTEDVINRSDVFALLNHNRDKGVLARSKNGVGSLTLSIDEVGLKYRFDAPNTALGDEVLEGIKRGDITASSFAFVVGKDTWTKGTDGTYLRTINSFDAIFDVSPVYKPAYDSTSVKVNKRGLDELQEQERAELEKVKLAEKKELDDYYNDLRSKIK